MHLILCISDDLEYLIYRWKRLEAKGTLSDTDLDQPRKRPCFTNLSDIVENQEPIATKSGADGVKSTHRYPYQDTTCTIRDLDLLPIPSPSRQITSTPEAKRIPTEERTDSQTSTSSDDDERADFSSSFNFGGCHLNKLKDKLERKIGFNLESRKGMCYLQLHNARELRLLREEIKNLKSVMDTKFSPLACASTQSQWQTIESWEAYIRNAQTKNDRSVLVRCLRTFVFIIYD